MSSTGPDRYYGSLNKTLRSSPGESQGNVFFQTGQGGRTVLPPLSSAFPTSRFPVPGCSNQYTPRSSPAKFEINPQLFHPSWSPPPSFPNYETQERYSQPQYTNYYASSSRTPPPISGIQHDPHRKLPRLATNPGCYTPSHIPSSNYTTSGTVHSPASYQPEYDYSTSSHHGYHNMHSQEYEDPYVPSMNPHGHMTTYEGLDGHRSNHGHRPSPPPSKSSSQPLSISPTDDSTVKKKRKRADPAQLKVLNETYNRTAFPSTEERLELAKALDMTPRSVQIWFQNKRQSMRQTNRQTSAASSSAQPYTMASQDNVMEDLVEPYGGSMVSNEMAYAQKHSPDASRSHHSASRRRNQEEAVDPRNLKWSSRGY